MNFTFHRGQHVRVDGVICVIVDCAIYDDEPDYLCKPLMENIKLLGCNEPGAAWVRADNIEVINE